jgi:hypothetical protein
MRFQKFHGLAPDRLYPSAPCRIGEAVYRSPDMDRARLATLY